MSKFFHSPKFASNYCITSKDSNSKESLLDSIQSPLPPLSKIPCKSQTTVNLNNISKNKYNPTINCQDFWSARMKAEIWKLQKRQMKPRIKTFIDKHEAVEDISIQQFKSKYLRRNYFCKINSPKNDPLAIKSIEDVICKCECELKKHRNGSPKVEFKRRAYLKKLTGL